MKHVLLLVFLFTPVSATQATPPVVIAHRGASGYLPEHTLAAKAMAHAMGTDFLEQDLVLSKEGIPVVLHDIHLDSITDVAKLFPGRQRADGRYYALDFTVAEMKQLRVTERFSTKTGKAVYPGRFPAGQSSFQIPTFEEELVFIAGLNKSTQRRVGIYPEIKAPSWHRKQGHDISSIVVKILWKHDFKTKADACWLQCFEHAEVKRLRHELAWEGRLLQLLSGGRTGSDGTDFQFFRSPAGLAELARLVDGIGPSLGSVIGTDGKLTELVRDAHAQDLAVHPYTVRADKLPKGVASLDDLHRLTLVDAGADGVFTDFPDKTAMFIRSNSPSLQQRIPAN